MNKFNDYNTKVFGLHMKNGQLNLNEINGQAINVKPTTLGVVKNQIETTLVEEGLRLLSLKFLHYDFYNSFSKKIQPK